MEHRLPLFTLRWAAWVSSPTVSLPWSYTLEKRTMSGLQVPSREGEAQAVMDPVLHTLAARDTPR